MKVRIFLVLVLGMAWSVGSAEAQRRTIRPSPAYHQGRSVQPEETVQPAPVYAPASSAQEPVYRYEPEPQPQLTLAPATYEEYGEYEEFDDDEEGIYWPWGQKWPGMALGPKIGTTGIGVDLIFGINSYLNLRGGFNYGSFSLNTELGDVDYDLDLDMATVPLLVDIYPMGGHFHLTLGAYIQPDSKADLESTPSSPVQIGAHTYAPDVVGTLSGEAEFSNVVAPYLGIGFGNTVGEDQLLTFMLDFGFIFQAYDVTLTSNGAGMETIEDTFREDLKKEEARIQDDLDSFKIFPVLTLGLAYHF